MRFQDASSFYWEGRFYVSFWGTAEVHGPTASVAFDANDPKVT